MCRNFMAMVPSNRPVAIARQGTLVYMIPTVIPCDQSDSRYSEAPVNALIDDLDLDDCNIELRGITDVVDRECGHMRHALTQSMVLTWF